MNTHNHSICLVGIVVSAIVGASPLSAQTIRNWNGGGGDDNWTTAGNWNVGISAGETAKFYGSTRLTPNNDFAAGTTFGDIRFANTAGSFTLGGNAIVLGGSTSSYNIYNESSALQTINMDIDLGARQRQFRTIGDMTINGVISGTQNIQVAGSGQLNLTNANTFTGTLLMGGGGGNVRLANANALQNVVLGLAVANPYVFADGINNFFISGLKNNAHSLNLADDGGNPVTVTIQGNGGGASEIARSFAGSGSVIFAMNPAGLQRLTGGSESPWTGSMTIESGTVRIETNYATSASNDLIINGGTLEMFIANSTLVLNVGALSGTGGKITTVSTLKNLSIRADSASNTSFAGVIERGTASGSVAFIKEGTGTLALSGSNTYNGTTTVSAGTLLINGDQSGATGDVNVSSGATLGGTGEIGGNTNIASGGVLSPGNSPGTLTFTADIILNNGSTAIFEGGDLVDVGGQLTFNAWTLSLRGGFQDGGSYTLFKYATLDPTPNLNPTFDISQLGFTPSGPLSLFNNTANKTIDVMGISIVPEPSTAALLLGGAALGLLARRRRRE